MYDDNMSEKYDPKSTICSFWTRMFFFFGALPLYTLHCMKGKWGFKKSIGTGEAYSLIIS